MTKSKPIKQLAIRTNIKAGVHVSFNYVGDGGPTGTTG